MVISSVLLFMNFFFAEYLKLRNTPDFPSLFGEIFYKRAYQSVQQVTTAFLNRGKHKRGFWHLSFC